jgi:hypothetical protein
MEGEFAMFVPPQVDVRTGQLKTALPPSHFFEELVAKALAPMPLAVGLPVPPPDRGPAKIDFREPSLQARRIAELVGQRFVGEEIDATTDHAWLVVLGYLAQALGLIVKLGKVPIAQRTGPKCTPQTKLIEFLVGILGGIEYLQDLNCAELPIVRDPTIAQAWSQEVFAHYSSVSRTLEATDEESLAAIVEALLSVSRPFIEAAVMDMLKCKGFLTVDVDLTGREVSPTSIDYPDATFGWMDGEVAKGYQAAVTSLVCVRWTRLLLTLQRYTGQTHSAECLQAAMQAVEETLGVRPRRRVELVRDHGEAIRAQHEQQQALVEHNQQEQRRLWQRIAEEKAEARALGAEVQQLEAAYEAQGHQAKKHCRLAKARHRWSAAQKREERAWRDLQKLQRRQREQQARLATLHERLLALDEWLAHLETDNLANPNPVVIVLRVDAGFSTGLNLTWVIEMGYVVLTKAHHNGTAHSLCHRVVAGTEWTRVGCNAEAVYMGDYEHNDCPYPLQALLVRYHLPDEPRYTALLYYGEELPASLPAWFVAYNARQTIEAGIKEEKEVFTLKRHLVRSPIGMQIQEQFALFGANFIRWAAEWVNGLLRQASHRFRCALDQVKTLVRVVSHARARWVRNALGHVLILDENGPFAGTVLCLSGQVAVQLTLPLFKFAPPRNI